MGSFDGAEIWEVVGLYIQNKLGEKYGKERIGLYRDREVAEKWKDGGMHLLNYLKMNSAHTLSVKQVIELSIL